MKKRILEVVVISDLNLGTPECQAKELLVYLSSIKPKILVLNGDIISGQESDLNEFPPSHARVLKKLQLLSLEGTKIYYLKGDQDEFLRKSKNNIPGNFTIDKELFLQLDGKKTWILHGDVFDAPSKLTQRIRHSWKKGLDVLFAFRESKKPYLRQENATVISPVLYKPINNPERTSECHLERKAAERAIKKGIDTVICSHNHQPKKALYKNHSGQCLYLNSGDWMTHLSALEYTFKRWKLYSFKRDKLTAFYGDEALKDLTLSELHKDFWNRAEQNKQRTAS
ncbi:UDP-2,3-diacylglucosamine diphosphatase [Muriicola soli]|uniref:UDP-2,3-diacylglucosamine diphosphatase n=1 Tax=Muriicola soli TaxID=2507538 RepID=UPI0013EBD09B|nr:UDP-2,3-diacylglucosamine diphosphatase [Muriicola soli]